MNVYFRFDGFEFRITRHDSRAVSFCESDAESVRVGHGIAGFDVGGGGYQRPVGRFVVELYISDRLSGYLLCRVKHDRFFAVFWDFLSG